MRCGESSDRFGLGIATFRASGAASLALQRCSYACEYEDTSAAWSVGLRSLEDTCHKFEAVLGDPLDLSPLKAGGRGSHDLVLGSSAY